MLFLSGLPYRQKGHYPSLGATFANRGIGLPAIPYMRVRPPTVPNKKQPPVKQPHRLTPAKPAAGHTGKLVPIISHSTDSYHIPSPAGSKPKTPQGRVR